MILPFSLTLTTANIPQSPTSLSQNAILAALVASSNTLAAYGLTPPPYGFRISGLRFESSVAGVVQFGLYNGSVFFEEWSSQVVAFAQATARFSATDGFLNVPAGNAFVPAFRLSAAPVGNVLLTGELSIAGIDTIPPINTPSGPSAPVVLSATINGSTLTWAMNEPVTLSSGAGITVTDGSNTYTATYVSGSTTSVITFTTSSAVSSGDIVTQSYAQATGNIVATVGGAPLASFTNAPVTNLTSASALYSATSWATYLIPMSSIVATIFVIGLGIASDEAFGLASPTNAIGIVSREQFGLGSI